MMLAGRFLQGIGVAGPRTITLALVRDRFEGREMARVMSLITVVFILVPVVAPAIGQTVLAVSGWRAIFGVYLATGLVATIWFALRQEETLPSERRIPLGLGRIVAATREVVGHRQSIGYTVASGLIFGALLGYLSSAQQILQQRSALGPRFPLFFAMVAIAIGAASFANASLVIRYGMRTLANLSLRGIFLVSVAFAAFAATSSGHPPLWWLMAYLMTSFFGIGLLFGNLNALAMQPLGHIAGTGAAIVGATSMLISLVLGTWIGQSYNGTVLPLVIGFAALSACAMLVSWWAEVVVHISPTRERWPQPKRRLAESADVDSFMRLSQAVNIADLRRMAQSRLPPVVFDYIDGGAEDEITLRDNERAFADVTFRPRQCVETPNPDLRTTVLGTTFDLPFLLAPLGFCRMFYPRGESVAARRRTRPGRPTSCPRSPGSGSKTSAPIRPVRSGISSTCRAGEPLPKRRWRVHAPPAIRCLSSRSIRRSAACASAISVAAQVRSAEGRACARCCRTSGSSRRIRDG